MSVAVESCRGNESPRTQSLQNSADSSIQLPNVFVTPPEEEYDAPPWCCFDADKDAQPGAFVYDDYRNHDFDYAAHAEEEIFGRTVAGHPMAENVHDSRGRQDVFVMHSLMQEAEHLKERLKSLDLSGASYSSYASPLPLEDDEDEVMFDGPEVSSPATATFSTIEAEQKVKRRKSLFAFRPLSRRKSFDEASPVSADGTLPSASSTSVSDADNTISGSGAMPSTQDSMDVASVRSGSSRKSSGFFSRFKLSSKRSTLGSEEIIRQGRTSANICQSQEQSESTQEQEREPVIKRRFSIFELPRRRASFSTQRIPTNSSTAPSMIPSMNHSTSSLSTSSVPPTPDVAICDLNSPPSSPKEKTVKRGLPIMDTSFLSTMEDVHGLDNIAASLTLPVSHGLATDGQFSLDPLHFESLQFDSDDFA